MRTNESWLEMLVEVLTPMTSSQAQFSNRLVTLRNAAVRLLSFLAVTVSAGIDRTAAVRSPAVERGCLERFLRI